MCSRPRLIDNPVYKDGGSLGESPFPLDPRTHLPSDAVLAVPCGKCPECIRARRNSLTQRLRLELYTPSDRSSDTNYFLTLTIAPRYYGEQSLSVWRSRLRRYFDLLRKRFPGCKYAYISELGERTGRLHFHALLFHVPHILYVQVQKAWRYGHVFVLPAKPAAADYLTKYIMKSWFDKSLFIYGISSGVGSSASTVSSRVDPDGIPVYKECVPGRAPVSLGRYARNHYVPRVVRLAQRLIAASLGRLYHVGDKTFDSVLSYIEYVQSLPEHNAVHSFSEKLNPSRPRVHKSLNIEAVPDEFAIDEHLPDLSPEVRQYVKNSVELAREAARMRCDSSYVSSSYSSLVRATRDYEARVRANRPAMPVTDSS